MGSRSKSLDGLRGIAALAVVVYHSVLGLTPVTDFNELLVQPVHLVQSGYALATRLVLMVFNGKLAVVYFFVLSGAVLMKSLVDGPPLKASTAAKFAVRRVARLYPTLIVCLLVFYLSINGLHVIEPKIFAQQIPFSSLVENSLLTKISMHGATWTLQVEVLMIPVMLLAALLWRVGGLIALVPLVAFAFSIYGSSAYFAAEISSGALAFLLGAVAIGEHAGRVVHRLPAAAWAVFAGAAVALPHFFMTTNAWAQLATLLLCAASVACLYHGRGGVCLTSPPMQALGRISYSLYLFNVVLMNIFIAAIVYVTAGASAKHPLEYGMLLACITLIASIPVAIWSERLLERPSIEFGRWISGQRLAFRIRPTDRQLPPLQT